MRSSVFSGDGGFSAADEEPPPVIQLQRTQNPH
jgi:hypothetical protein